MPGKVFIETKRVLIKELEPMDFPILSLQQKDADMMAFFGAPRDDAKIETINQLVYQHLLDYGFSVGLIFNKETKECMGRGGLVYLYFKGPPDVERAIFLYKKFWNQGYATEIALALTEHAFIELNKEQVFSTIDPHNEVMRHINQKIGMTFLKEEYYSLLKKNVHVYVKNQLINNKLV